MGEQTVRWLTDYAQAAGAAPAWAAGAFAALVVFLAIKKIIGRGDGGILAAFALTGIAVVALAGFMTFITFALQYGHRDRFNVRPEVEARVSQLVLQAMMPGSPLGCLHIEAGMAIDAACEDAIFSSAPAFHSLAVVSLVSMASAYG